jgi:acyl carrier protein
MKEAQILKELDTVFSNILDRNIYLTPQTEAQDVQGWDSLTHLELMVAIEKHFKIRFTTFQIQSFKNVGNLIEVIHDKVK